MNQENKKYLPIGTVVMLKDARKRIMVTGFCSCDENDKNKIFDYNGCLYPEGFISSKQVFLFNHEQIDKVYSLGYSDEEEQSFKIRLEAAVEQLSSQQSGQQSNMQPEPIVIKDNNGGQSNDFLN